MYDRIANMGMRKHEWSGPWGRAAKRDPALLWAIAITERERAGTGPADEGGGGADVRAEGSVEGEGAAGREGSGDGTGDWARTRWRRWRRRLAWFLLAGGLLGPACLLTVPAHASRARLGGPASPLDHVGGGPHFG
jgi:hypothetical protein